MIQNKIYTVESFNLKKNVYSTIISLAVFLGVISILLFLRHWPAFLWKINLELITPFT